MHRLAAIILAVTVVGSSRAGDAFDLYTNPILAKVPKADGAQAVRQVSREQIIDNDHTLPRAAGAFVVVKTNDNRWSKLLVQYALHRIAEGKTMPLVSVERFTTFKEGQEQAIQAASQNVNLYPGFRLNLDLGQVVPQDLGGDLRFVVDGDKAYLEALGEAKLYLVTKPLPEAAPKKGEKVIVGEKFDPKYFNGIFELRDDGRRSGKLTLKVNEEGGVTGTYVSDKDGSTYDVRGHVGAPPHSVEFTVRFPRVEQIFKGWLFTADAKAITGSSRLGEREAGFYAIRVEEK
jgi:hypothetical protein